MSSITWADVQKHLGIAADGVPGQVTLRAVAARLGINESILKERSVKNPEAFYVGVRKVTGGFNDEQFTVTKNILEGGKYWPTSWTAYALATAWHECKFKPVPEIGKGRGRFYAKPGARSNKTIGPVYCGKAPYGRGLVQLTWVDNYEWADKTLCLNGALLADFDLALDLGIATKILIKGMEEGAFTSKGLKDYLKNDVETWTNFKQARRIINGVDRNELIADYAVKFQDALRAGGW